MDKSIIAYPLKILVSIEIFDLKVPFFTIFLYIGYGPMINILIFLNNELKKSLYLQC